MKGREEGGGSQAGLPAQDIRQWLIARVAEMTHSEASSVETSASFLSLGLDSVTGVGMTCDLESFLRRKLPPTLLAAYDTIDDLARHLEAHRETFPPLNEAPPTVVAPASAVNWFGPLTERVARMRETDTFFYEPTLSELDGAWAVVEGRRVLMMSSYSYLGLLGDARINAASCEAVQRFGTGSTAARLLGGTTRLHVELEERIAAFTGHQRAVVFTTGFLACMSTIITLVGPGDVVIGDTNNHACIVDGCRYSGAHFVTFGHNDLSALEGHLRSAGQKRKLVVVDGVYSMDGDFAPLPEIVGLCRQYGALLMVDEAHSIGVMGKTGRGLAEHFGLPDGAIDIHMGTLSKAIPSVGGFIAGKQELIDALKYNARGWVFSVALPPPQVAAASAAIDVMMEEPWRVEKLRQNTKRYAQRLRAAGFDVHDGRTPIVPIAYPDEQMTFEMTRRCREAGVMVYPIVYPAVPANAPRIRTTVTAAHSDSDIDLAVDILSRANEAMGRTCA